jgi:tetratricopeptide (TPR) repeat protein
MRTTGCILRLGGILAMAFASGVLADAPPDDPVATPAATATDETGTGLEFDAIEDPLRRADRRLTVAATILREEIPPRVRTRLIWTPFSPRLAQSVRSPLARAGKLVEEASSDLASTTGPGRDRRIARAICLATTLETLEIMSRPGRDRIDSKTLRRLHRGLGDATERTTDLDGPTLAGLAFLALVAEESASTRSPATLLTRVRENPAGVDALEFEWLDRLAKTGTATATSRLAIARGMLRIRRRDADRLLLAAILLQAASETMPIAEATRTALVELLRTTEENPRIRPRLVRGLAGIASGLDRGDDAGGTPPLIALGRAIEFGEAGDLAMATRLANRALDADNEDVVVEARLELANLALRADRADEAIEQLVAACELLPAHPSGLRAAELAARLADADPDDRRHATTIGRLAAAMPRHPGLDDWIMRSGERAMRRGDEAAARDAWNSIDRRSTRGPEALVRICELRERGVETELLLRRLDAIDDRLPADPLAPLRVDADLVRIELLLDLDRVSSAARIAARWTAPAPLPADEGTRVRLATLAIEALRRDGRDADAAGMLARLERDDPALARRLLATARHEAHRLVVASLDADDRRVARAAAEAVLAVATRTTPGEDPRRSDVDDTALLEWAWIDAAAGRPEEATARLARILEDNPDATEPLALQAILLGGRITTASDASRTAPTDADAAAAIGILTRIVRGTTPADPIWWRCEIERLELLHLLGRNLDRIGPRIDRLRAERPDCGSEAFRRRFERLRGLVAAPAP